MAVTAVAGIAAVISYTHVYDLGRAHGQSGTAARLLPLSVDGLILAASLTLLLAARNHQRAPALPRFALWLGIGGTVAANLAYGTPYGLVGAIVSAWPGLAFVLAVEILLGMLRRSSTSEVASEAVLEAPVEAVPESPATAVPVTDLGAPGALPRKASRRRGVHRAPEVVFAQDLAGGVVPSVRQVKSRMRCGQDKAVVIRTHLADLIAVSEPRETVDVTV